MPDPFEGVPADIILDDERATNRQIQAMLIDLGMDPNLAQTWKREIGAALWRRITYVNCWHMNNYESMAMWHLYSQDGLAIQSTFRRLKDSFRSHPKDILIGKVIYRDRRDPTSAEPRDNQLHPAIRKGKSYEHEHELRAITTHVPGSQELTRFDPGINIRPVDLDALIESVYVSPGCPEWFHALIGTIMNRYGLNNRLRPSALDERPDLT